MRLKPLGKLCIDHTRAFDFSFEKQAEGGTPLPPRSQNNFGFFLSRMRARILNQSQRKKHRLKHKPIANFRLRQIPDSHLAAPCKSAFAQTVNRTKTFHVKHFCPIGG
jgi:hypothetical protein